MTFDEDSTGQLFAGRQAACHDLGVPLPLPVDVLDNWVDYVALVIAFLAAVGTLLAVWVSVRSAQQSRRDAIEERNRADRAATEGLRARARAEAERKAERQAGLIAVRGHWQPFSEGREEIARDFRAPITLSIENPTSFAIFDVRARFHRTFGLANPEARTEDGEPVEVGIPVIAPHSHGETTALQYVYQHTWGDGLGFQIEFTDAHDDRWRLEPDRSLILLTPRRIGTVASEN